MGRLVGLRSAAHQFGGAIGVPPGLHQMRPPFAWIIGQPIVIGLGRAPCFLELPIAGEQSGGEAEFEPERGGHLIGVESACNRGKVAHAQTAAA